MTYVYERALDEEKRNLGPKGRRSGLLLDDEVVPVPEGALIRVVPPAWPTQVEVQKFGHPWRRLLWSAMQHAPAGQYPAFGYGLIVCQFEDDPAAYDVLKVWAKELAETNCTPGPVRLGVSPKSWPQGVVVVKNFDVPKRVMWVHRTGTLA